MMTQYKYYLKKPKGEIMKDILRWVAIIGVTGIASTSPYFANNILRAFQKKHCYQIKNISNAFYRLKKKGYIKIKQQNHQIYISLTQEGKKKAGRFQINALHIKKPKKWDKKWRIIMFDITESHKIKREALRGIFKKFAFYQLQKSVWIFPYNCRDEIDLLRDFFGLTIHELRFVIAEKIDNDNIMKQYFNL